MQIKSLSALGVMSLLALGMFRWTQYQPGARAAGETCVSNCTARDYSGTCYEYAADFCAENAKCVTRCTSRDNFGNCFQFGPDFCGKNARCTPDCRARDNAGTCYEFGPDACSFD